MFAPKVLLGGLRDRTVEYTTWVWGFTKFAKSFYSNREFRSLNCSAVLIFRNPGKLCLPPKVLLGGLRDRTVVSIRHGYGGSLNLPNLSIQTENFEAYKLFGCIDFP